MGLYKMKEQLAMIGQELRSVSEEIRALVTDPASKMEDIRSKQTHQNEVQERFELLKAEVDKEESENKKRAKLENPVAYAGTDELRMKAAVADFIRSGFVGGPVSDETRNLLGALPVTDASGGAKLLPVNMQNTLVHEPFATNPLRGVVATSAIKGLELPKIAYELDDDAYISDADTAKELELTGDVVAFGRNKMKIMARISDTVMHGSDTDLAAYVQNALNSGLAAKEKKVMLAATPATGEEHMSFYDTTVAITEISGADLYEAITSAIADLDESYRENAKIVMRYADYVQTFDESFFICLGNSFYNFPKEVF